MGDVCGGDLLDLLADLVELALADHLVDAALELAGDGTRLSGPSAERAQYPWQVLRPDHQECHDGNRHEVRPRNIEHRLSPHAPPFTLIGAATDVAPDNGRSGGGAANLRGGPKPTRPRGAPAPCPR